MDRRPRIKSNENSSEKVNQKKVYQQIYLGQYFICVLMKLEEKNKIIIKIIMIKLIERNSYFQNTSSPAQECKIKMH